MKKTPLKRKTRLKPMSDKKKAMQPAYRAAVKEARDSQIRGRGHEYCSNCGLTCIPGPHHPFGSVGKNLLRFVMIGWECCHRKIHEQTKRARKLGLLDKWPVK